MKKNNHQFKKNQGFTLIEVIVAVSIIAAGIGGVIKIIPPLLSGVSANESQLEAAYLAQEGIEIVRNIRDTNWLERHNRADSTPWDEDLAGCFGVGCEIDHNVLTSEDPSLEPSFFVYGGRKLKFDSINGYNYTWGTETKFTRKITITGEHSVPDPDPLEYEILNILVEVSWTEKGKAYKFPVQEKLYKWY